MICDDDDDDDEANDHDFNRDRLEGYISETVLIDHKFHLHGPKHEEDERDARDGHASKCSNGNLSRRNQMKLMIRLQIIHYGRTLQSMVTIMM